MILSKAALDTIALQNNIIIPQKSLFELPEKVLQFGTGVLLRGLPDYFIDKANKEGNFNGRVVMVKSTSAGDVEAFEKQDGLFTLCVRGVQGNEGVEENILNASISRVLSANSEWHQVLQYAAHPEIQLVISNTTEVGITLSHDNVDDIPPRSFPGKLLAFLYRRFKVYGGDKDKGLVIIPTELVIDNGTRLKDIVLELARINQLGQPFADWISSHNYFCNSLVDRIVPGKLTVEQQAATESKLGYQDELMIMSEVYRLWAIETSEQKVRDVLSFEKSDSGIVITDDIGVFRELKLRLLNGSHSFTCGLAHLCGVATVRQAMEDAGLRDFITRLMLREIVPAIESEQISTGRASEFAFSVIDRFRNPYLDHRWLSIGVQYSLKMRNRNVPMISRYFELMEAVPPCMTLGFAAFLLFMKPSIDASGICHEISDDHAGSFSETWETQPTAAAVAQMMCNEKLWGFNLLSLPGFYESVFNNIEMIEKWGARAALMNSLASATSNASAIHVNRH